MISIDEGLLETLGNTNSDDKGSHCDGDNKGARSSNLGVPLSLWVMTPTGVVWLSRRYDLPRTVSIL